MLFSKKIIDEVDEGYISINKKTEVPNDYAGRIKNYVDIILPEAIEVDDPNCINVGGTYISHFICQMPYEIHKGFFDDIINAGEGIEIIIHHIHGNKTKAIQDITHYLGFTEYKLSTGGEHLADSEIQQNARAHSIYMKRGLANGDEIYYIAVIIKVSAESKEKLDLKMRSVESILAGKDILAKRANFRQLEAFLTTLPIQKIEKSIEKKISRNILSSSLCATYPFTSSVLSDPEGIFMGVNKHDGSQVILDLFNTQNYANANMVIMGTSGSGKTFTTQMITNRFRMLKIPVMMICPLKGYEYRRLCENVGGNYIRIAAGSNHTINILDIRPTKNIENEDESMLAAKLQKMQMFFSLMIPEITNKEKQLLDDILIKVYAKKGITTDNSSIFERPSAADVISLSPRLKKMPVMQDLYDAISKVQELESIAVKLKTFVSGSLSFFNGSTNIDLHNPYIVADISDMQEDLIPLAMFMVLDIFWDRIKQDITQKKCIVLDEAWKLMGAGGNAQTAKFVLEIFKIIRGYGGSAIAATQDVGDFLALEDGKYGRGIINNAKLKIVLQMESFEIAAVKDVLELSEEEQVQISHFERGNGLLYAAGNHVAVNFKPFETERKLITTDRTELSKIRAEGGIT